MVTTTNTSASSATDTVHRLSTSNPLDSVVTS